MSYRSIKRFLGETHLEFKCLVLFGFCILLLTGGSFWFYGGRTEDLVYKQNRFEGREAVNTIFAYVHWKWLGEENNEVGKKLADALTEEILKGRYTWQRLLPSGVYAEDSETSKTSKKPLNDFDSQVLKDFLNAPRPADKDTIEWTDRRLPAQNEYHYYQAVRATGGVCATCHLGLNRPPGVKTGDIIGVIKVRIPDDEIQEAILWNNIILLTTAIVTAFLLVAASYLIIRYVIVKPVKHLQEVSEAIIRGDMNKRAEINTRDEFEALGTAFNRMVRHLVDLQQEAKEANAALDRKVDELAQSNMQLYEMNRLKGDFLATVSHELRTPLNSIIGFSDVLGSLDSLDEKYLRYVQNIQTSGKMLLELINDILDLAKIESGKMEIRLSDFRIDHVIHAQCDMARPLSEKKNIDLEIDIHPQMEELHQDQNKVQQILGNLLSNAIKFTPDGGRIAILVESLGDGFFRLMVSDTGVGIAEADQTKIFEKFRQGEAVSGGDAMTREYSGTGLGLSIVRELCKLLGGDISLESELGKGSIFTIRLPLHLPDQPETEPILPGPVADGLDGRASIPSQTGENQQSDWT